MRINHVMVALYPDRSDRVLTILLLYQCRTSRVTVININVRTRNTNYTSYTPMHVYLLWKYCSGMLKRISGVQRARTLRDYMYAQWIVAPCTDGHYIIIIHGPHQDNLNNVESQKGKKGSTIQVR